MDAVRRACMWLGMAATLSLLVSLLVMMFVAETAQVARWFVASAALAALSYGAALLAACLQP